MSDENAIEDLHNIGESVSYMSPCVKILVGQERLGKLSICNFTERRFVEKNECSIYWEFAVEDPSVIIDDIPILKKIRARSC